MKRTGRRRGFTLIELLVVIAIITILVSMVVTLVINVQRNAQIKRTTGTIQSLVSGMTSYHADFRTYPPIFINEMTASGGAKTTKPSAIKRNEALYDYLTMRVKIGTKFFGPWIDDEIKNSARDTDGNTMVEFIDAWGLYIVFNMPGEDHQGDIDVDGKKVPGPNHMCLEDSAGVWNESVLKFDLYSYGPNLIDDTKSTSISMLFRDKGADGRYGFYKSGDSGDPPGHKHVDDVTSWGDSTRKAN